MVFGSADIHITQELFWKLGSGLYLFLFPKPDMLLWVCFILVHEGEPRT